MQLKQLVARLEWANLSQPKKLEIARKIVAELNTNLGKVIELASTVSLHTLEHDIRLDSQSCAEGNRAPKLAFRVPGGISVSLRSPAAEETLDVCDDEEPDFVSFGDASYSVQELMLPYVTKLANLLVDCS
ncbi:hypothetical protein [Anatilimnocola floriformis]|uniref:hypothetical protein n=1 Tax=Anatilimnocola floriformis TaxID=2948575 RepID=UPI0020C5B2C9|nr:hypothetical protein [Anatilimnocola floriformis]